MNNNSKHLLPLNLLCNIKFYLEVIVKQIKNIHFIEARLCNFCFNWVCRKFKGLSNVTSIGICFLYRYFIFRIN